MENKQAPTPSHALGSKIEAEVLQFDFKSDSDNSMHEEVKEEVHHEDGVESKDYISKSFDKE